MRLLLFLSALLASLTGVTGPARAAVGVERSVPALAEAEPATAAKVGGTPSAVLEDRPVAEAAGLPSWSLMPAIPRWIERLRV